MKSTILRAFGRASQAAPWDNEESIREELFSIERLEQHAESLAAAQPVTAGPASGRSLAVRLKENESILLDAYRAIARAVGEGGAITPAAEWLLDNYHLVEEQIREIRDDLPPGYYRQLPKLADGPFAGYPRVFGVAWAFVAHTDSRFDPEMLRRFVRAYQRVQPLTIGELWAVAITLRVVLVENLRRGARRIVAGRAARQEADALADRLLGVNAPPAESIAPSLQHYEEAPLPAAFAVQLVQRLRDQDPKVTPALLWLEERLAAQGTTADAIVHDEHQRQGATNVTVRNVITSMRLISDVDWSGLVEDVSLIDDTLRPGSDFAQMDFPTRNLYRSAIEALARGSRLSELEIAREALAAANDPALQKPEEGDDPDRRKRDPGYHLIAGGRRAFEATIGFRAPLRTWPGRFSATIGIRGYIGGVMAVAAIILAMPLAVLAGAGIGAWWLGVLAALGLIPSIDAAMALVNRAVTRGFGAMILPGLELRDGVPSHLRTVVAVPILLTTRAALEEQLEGLEIHHLASPEGELHFALLSDWTDAVTETVQGDDALLDAAVTGIARLNRRYGPAAGGDRFLLFHRRRVWNEGQRRWIGWERKRGKLHELNRLLRGATDTTFVRVGERLSAPPAGVRYVITLDADTRMPRETARRLVGKMAHALNRPRFDPVTRRVVDGYGVLQPRVTPSLPVGREGSLFQRISSSMSGIDPYSAAVSDVYQDLFGEGSYTGKGIYDVDAFEAALDARVPENALLSHDLFEGTFARAGLASDIEVVEEFPSRYDVAAGRQHRWARGDWQLAPWILGRGEASADDRSAGALPLIGRWKMLDNLRRSLSAPASLVALVAGWTLPLQAALVWTGFILSTIALSTLLPVLSAIVPRRARVTARSHLRALAADVRLALSQTALLAVFLAHQAWLMADAIGRTLFRLLVSRRHLLDWVTAAQSQVSPRLDLAGFYRQMNGGVAVGIVVAAVVWWVGRDAWPVAAPFIIAWIASPAIARWTSLSPLVAGRVPVSTADASALRLVARRTWRFFETFVTPTDHMLPPDNFQEDPKPVVAHRTSPTNLGVYLLSAVSARDFGWAGTIETVDRLEAALATMGGLARFRGHFYNWYDTRDLRPLDPQYVSSVDSGNLAGHLVALANACREWIGRTAAGPEVLAGIEDALQLTRESLAGLPDDRRTQTITRHQLGDALDALAAALRRAPMPPEDIGARLAEAAPHAATMADIARTLASERGDDAGAEMLFWAEATLASIESHRRDVAPDADAARSLERRLTALEATARTLAGAMEFGFLLDPERKLLSIGYRVADGMLDPSCYDLLASEARLASFVAIAKGDVPPRHWFRLGRAVTSAGRGAALISWSGSMFEYLMPSLVMRAPAGSLLEETSRLVVRRQVSYGATLDVPWGISESAYNVRDLEHTYQYSNFGVPGLGLKRGLGENAVVAPYATALAAMVDPGAAARNFARLAADRRAWPLRLLRGPGLHAHASAGGEGRCDRPRLHGAPSGHDRGRDRQRAPGRRDAGTVSCRADRAGDGAAAAGTHAARRRGGASQGGGSQDGGDGPRPGAASGATAPLPARRHAASAPALERPVRGHADGRRLRVQPLWRPRNHALARRRHPRRLGRLRLPARRAERRRVVRGLPAERRRAGPLRRHVHRGSRRVRPARRTDHHDARGPRLAGGQRRGSPRLGRECGQPGPGHRAHLVRRARAGAARRRHGAPGLLQALRADGIPPQAGRGPRDAAAPIARRARGLGGASRRRRRRSGGRAGDRNRPGPLPRPRTRVPGADRGDGWPAAVEYRRHGPRSRISRCDAACGCRRAGRRASRSGRSSPRPVARPWT